MPFDGFVTRALIHELREKLIHGRIHKIYQPHPSDLLLHIRSHKDNQSLLLSANPTYPRVYLTKENFLNPLEPPMFCMLLRKHLEGGIIENITQVSHERIIHIDVKTKGELGDIQNKRLIVEIMGKHSNIILINSDTNIIIDGIHHVTPAISSYRQVLPGKEYVAPPDQQKINPLEVTQEKFLAKLQFNQGKLDKQLVNQFEGMSPSVAREILYRAGLPTKENLWKAFLEWMEKARNHEYQPTIVYSDRPDFSILPLTHLQGERESFSEISLCLEKFYSAKAKRDMVKQKMQDLSKILINEKNKNEKKIGYLHKDLEQAKEAEKFKLYGELITAHMYMIKRGDSEVEVINYYDENQGLIKIPLDPLKTPSENAQHYFKKYNKLKNSLSIIKQQIKETKKEIEYLDTLLTQIENADLADLEDIRNEMVEQGYLRGRGKVDRRKNKNPEIEQYRSSEGVPIYVGKNNRQNEYLTHRLAHSTDTWLHTKDIPGSHVVIRGKDFGEQTLLEAATLAAYFSKAKHSSQVPVDYTLIKYVKKTSGAKPGFVIYENQKTLYITPDEKIIERLKVK
ncbi:Rqc2 family fibronectin-binding protein [Tepidibacillus sp. LV47]|uniref:Rqc2 family fibronectin-binding protein n=1 Tax=Tepidibacillus sp. LV47 TaxID=3398228 RepID=UPI003AAF91B9